MTAPVLFIGGMDSSGGAGLLRDAATATALGAAYRVAVTAVTAQSDRQVAATLPMPPDMVAAQIALTAKAGIAATKIGMLANRDVVVAVAANLPRAPLVLDPVLQSTSGHELLDAPGIAAFMTLLLPHTAVLTPNLPELAALAAYLGLAYSKHNPITEAQVANALLARGCAAVLVKGGHSEDSAFCEDRLYRNGQSVLPFRAPRLAASLRGTGCQLASALAIGLCAKMPLETAIATAKAMVTRRFQAGQTR